MLKIKTCSPMFRVGDVSGNAKKIKEICQSRRIEKDAPIIVFPQLALVGAAAGDLILNDMILDKCMEEMLNMKFYELPRFDTDDYNCVIFGAPIKYMNEVYDCAIVMTDILRQKIIAIPKKVETRKGFSSKKGSFEISSDGKITYFDRAPILQTEENIRIGFTVGDDIWCMANDFGNVYNLRNNIIININADKWTVDSKNKIKQRLKVMSEINQCGYLYVSGGEYQCDAGNIYASNSIAAQNGYVGCSDSLYTEDYGCFSFVFDEDVIFAKQKKNPLTSLVEHETERELIIPLITDIADNVQPPLYKHYFDHYARMDADAKYLIPRTSVPFCQLNDRKKDEILDIAISGIETRMKNIGVEKAVIGVSGGLDSTLVLLIAYNLMDRSFKNYEIIGVTMPCYGTTDRTKNNALKLMQALGVNIREIDITKSVEAHYEAIGHKGAKNPDIAFENAQARERTQVLMDIANMEGAIVLGTGNMSEAALGWCTYGGDQISMYNPNCGIPKTVIKTLVKHIADKSSGEVKEILYDILNTPVSPELLPLEDGKQMQTTEKSVGDYRIHDFILYHLLQYGYSPSKIFDKLVYTFDFYREVEERGIEALEEIIENFYSFYRRFHSSQFKRNCATDGVAVFDVSLSPQSGWVMPSDTSCSAAIQEIDAIRLNFKTYLQLIQS